MKKIFVIIISLVIFTGIIVFFIINYNPKGICVDNYNGTATLNLGEFELSEYNYLKASKAAPITSFVFLEPEEKGRFMDTIMGLDGYLGINPYGTILGDLNEKHYILHEGYYYLFFEKNEVCYLEPLYGIYGGASQFLLPFYIDIQPTENDVFSTDMTENQFIQFYEKMADGEVFIDAEKSTVYSNVMGIYSRNIVEGYPIKIVYNEGEITIGFSE